MAKQRRTTARARSALTTPPPPARTRAAQPRACGFITTYNPHPCTQPAGAGTTTPGRGRCRDHTPAALSAIATIKARFLAEFAKQPTTMRQASIGAGSSMGTIYNYRRTDREFAEAVLALVEVVEEQRVDMIEDAAFIRGANPLLPADPLRMWLLQNLRGGKYRDTRRFEHTGANGTPLEPATKQVFIIAGQRIEY